MLLLYARPPNQCGILSDCPPCCSIVPLHASRSLNTRDRDRQTRLHEEHGDNLFESQNEALLNQLGGKVSALKSLSISIGDTIKTSNQELDDLVWFLAAHKYLLSPLVSIQKRSSFYFQNMNRIRVCPVHSRMTLARRARFSVA
jgi:hypothetical protein